MTRSLSWSGTKSLGTGQVECDNGSIGAPPAIIGVDRMKEF